MAEKRLVFIGACFMLIAGLRDFAVILNNMRQRAERIGASLTFLDACPGLGIRLCFVLHETPEHSSLIGAGAANIDIDFDLIEQASNR